MTPRASTEQLLVQVLMRSTQEVLRVLAEHSAEAPQRSQASRELELAFAPIWSRLPYLTLDVLAGSIFWREQVVLDPEEDRAGLADILSQSGIHGVTFVPGVESEEIRHFLEVVDRKRRLDADGDQDLVTLLFREDLQYVRYTVGAVSRSLLAETGETAEPTSTSNEPEAITLVPLSDDVAAESVSLETLPLEDVVLDTAEPVDVRDAVREEANAGEEGRGVVQLEKFDSTLYFLDQREIEYLRGAIDQQYEQDEVENVLGVLLDILQLQSEPAVRDEVIDILTTLMPYLLGTGRFDALAYLTGEVRTLVRTVEFAEDHKDALVGLRVGVSETRALVQLFHALDGGAVAPSAANLNLLLRELSPEAMQSVVVWVGQLQRPEAKTALIQAIDAFFTEWPNALTRMLEATDRNVVHRALGIARRLKLPDFVESIGGILGTEDPKARRLAAAALAQIGTGPALREVIKLLPDSEESVRKVVLKTLVSRPYRGAEKPLIKTMGSKDLEQRDIAERRALFTAYGLVSGAGGVSVLEPILFGKGSLARRPSAETRACAAVALGVIGTPAARFALEKAAKDKDPLVRSAARSALRGED